MKVFTEKYCPSERRVRKLLFLMFTLLMLGGCVSSTQEVKELSSPEELAKIVFAEKVIDKSNYAGWLKGKEGITYDEAENDKIKITLLYKPVSFEALTSNSTQSDSAFQSTLKQKNGFHYFRLQWWDKNTSLVNPTSKEKTFASLSQSLRFVQNNRDTLTFISETLKASLINQPNEMIMILPYDSAAATIQCILNGTSFGIRTMRLSITRQQLESFPEIKL